MIEARQRPEPSFCRGPGEVLLAVGVVGGAQLLGEFGRNPTLSELKLRAEPGSRRSPGGVCLRLQSLASRMKSGSLKSTGEVLLQLKLKASLALVGVRMGLTSGWR